MKLSAVLCILAASMAAAAPLNNADAQYQNQPQNNNNNNNNNNQNNRNQNQNQNNRLTAEEQKYQVSDNNHKIGRSEILYPREFGSPSSEPVAPGYSELGSPKVYVPENNLHAPKAPKEDYKSEEYKTDDIKSKGYQSVSSKPEVHQSVDFKPEVPKPEAPKPPAHPVNHVPTKQHESFSYDTHESYESQTTEQQ